MTRKIMVAGNWKMHNTIGQALSLIEEMAPKLTDTHKVDVVVAPPFTAVAAVASALEATPAQVAGQDVYWEESGAYTGQVSPMMLKEAGAKWVIVGHSERRQYFGETDETVNKKTIAAISAGGLRPIVCVGETLREREEEKTFQVLDRQVTGALRDIDPEELASLVIAYEPVWAIGTGKTATPAQADQAHAHIRAKVATLYGDEAAGKLRILYGGSVKPGNAAELFACEHIDGGLIGGASLKASDFLAIIKAATPEG